jgi:hypothetical protein
VYDLADENPEEVLHRLLGHLERLKEDGDEIATHVRTHLRVIVRFLPLVPFPKMRMMSNSKRHYV